MTERELYHKAINENILDRGALLRRAKANHGFPRWAVAALAFILLTAAGVLAAPSARAQVGSWFRSLFSAQGYMLQQKDARTNEPAMDALTAPVHDAADPRITKLYDDEDAAYYAENFGLRLSDVMCDGDSIFITGALEGEFGRWLLEQYISLPEYRTRRHYGSAEDYAAWEAKFGYPLSEDTENYMDVCEASFTLTLQDGTVLSGMMNSIGAPEFDALLQRAGEYREQGKSAAPLVEEFLQANDTPFVLEFPLRNVTNLESSKATLSMRLGYVAGVLDEYYPILDAALGEIEIDAEGWAEYTKSFAGSAIRLYGERLIAVTGTPREGWRTLSGMVLNLGNVSVALKEAKLTPSDLQLTLEYELPEEWGDDIRYSLWRAMVFRLYIDGVAIDEPFSAAGPHLMMGNTPRLYECTVPPERLKSAQDIRLVLGLRLMQSYSLTGKADFKPFTESTSIEMPDSSTLHSESELVWLEDVPLHITLD